MARIAGVNLPMNKRVEIALTYIYGIGNTTAKDILVKTGVSGDVRVKDLTEEQAGKLREHIEKQMNVEGELRREVLSNIKRLKESHPLLRIQVKHYLAHICRWYREELLLGNGELHRHAGGVQRNRLDIFPRHQILFLKIF